MIGELLDMNAIPTHCISRRHVSHPVILMVLGVPRMRVVDARVAMHRCLDERAPRANVL